MSAHPARLFFLHILKTGGTSFYRFLENNYPRDASIRDDRFAELHGLKADPEAFARTLTSFRLITKLHLDFSYVERLRRLDPRLRVVTLLREPVQRCFSMIEHWRRIPDASLADFDPVRRELLVDARSLPVEAFVQKHAHRLSDHQTKILAGEANPVANPPRVPLLAAAIANLASVEYVGLTERMTETAACLSSAMGFFDSMNTQKLNVTRDDRRLSSAEKEQVRGLLAELNQADTALYAEGELRFVRWLGRWKHERFRERSPSRPRLLAVGEACRFTMDEPLVGDGWHEREGGPEQSCRWGGPQRLSSLFLEVAAVGSLELTIRLVAAISEEVLSSLELVVAGQTVPHRIVRRDGRLDVTATAALDADPREWLPIELIFAATRSAYDVAGVDDHRQKTVAVEAVEMRRLA